MKKSLSSGSTSLHSRHPLFWVFQVLVFLGCTFLALKLYPQAFPTVDVPIQMDRTQALQAASRLAHQHHWGPENFKQAATFEADQKTQAFIELSAGGSQAFRSILKEGLYSPYTWKIRHFSPGNPREVQIRYKPQGDLYGFQVKLPESEPGAKLKAEVAQEIAETSFQKDWKMDLSAYHLVEKSLDQLPAPRTDHTFIYERQAEKIGGGTYRLKLVVGGDQLTEIKYFIKIPESFFRRYAEMRSSNETLASIASIAMMILYGLGGCVLGLFLLARKNWVLWKAPLIAAGIVSLIQLLEQMNQFPLGWMNYDTALSYQGFLLNQATHLFIFFLAEFLLLSVSFMAAESLSRRAFPNHPQFWRVWKLGNASSWSILGQTLGGYFSVGFFFAFVVGVYLLGRNVLGWWIPTDILFHPDGLATPFPWLTSLSHSLHAGFWEECLFRAVPLASATLIGERLGQRKKCIALGFVIQALIFSAAHANYPTQPSYSRILELILPSFFFGGLYILFGLLPGIILHFVFDVISFSIPLFTASTPGIWMDRSWVIFFALTPLWIVLISWIYKGQISELPLQEYNQRWKPKLFKKKSFQAFHEEPIPRLSPRLAMSLLGLSLIAGMIWFFTVPVKNQVLRVEIGRNEAIHLAQKALENSEIYLSSEWQPLALLTSVEPEISDLFIWKTHTPEVYQKLIGTYLSSPSWEVRFVRWEGSVQARAEEYQVFLTPDGQVDRIRHQIPEETPGKSLNQQEAKSLAMAALSRYSLPEASLLEVSSQSDQLPARKDWFFIFSDSSITLNPGEARVGVKIAGDEIASIRKFVFIPEDWLRMERNSENIRRLIKTFSLLTLGLVFLSGVIFSVMRWSQKKFEAQAFFGSFALFFVLELILSINSWVAQIARFSTQEPRLHQFISLIGFGLMYNFTSSTSMALIVGFLHHQAKSTFYPRFIGLPVGYSTGVLLSAVIGITSHLFPKNTPVWGAVSSLDCLFPALNSLRPFLTFVLITLIFGLTLQAVHFLTRKGSQRKILGSLFFLLMGLAASGTQIENLQTWITTGITLGISLICIQRWIMGSSLSLAPLITASALALSQIQNIQLQPYRGSTQNIGLTLIILGITSFLWYRSLNEKA